MVKLPILYQSQQCGNQKKMAQAITEEALAVGARPIKNMFSRLGDPLDEVMESWG